MNLHTRSKFCLIVLLLLTSSPLAAIDQDWIGEVVQLANKRCDYPPDGNIPKMSPSYFEPKDKSDQEMLNLILAGIQNETTPKRRMACLKILVERFPLATLKNLESIATNGSLDLEIRRRAIWVAGIARQGDSVVWLERLLQNMEPSIREAAIDALGLILFPHFTDKFFSNDFTDPLGVYIHGPIPIFVNSMFRINFVSLKELGALTDKNAALKLLQTNVQRNQLKNKSIDEATRKRVAQKLNRIMLKGRESAQRLAAARALAGYVPEEYQFRLAEWGVWIESNGKLELVQSVVDEIPPIAYQTQMKVAELKKRVNQIMIVTKPVIHLTVDRPMSVNVTAFIQAGQPWYSFPQPNDFALKVDGLSQSVREVTDNDFGELKKMVAAEANKWKAFGSQAHSGYPFLMPRSVKIGGYSGRFGRTSNGIRAIGIKWQHLVVSPDQLSWMRELHIEGKAYDWWTWLRDVDSSWVSNGRESEKFLYYDGPTLLPSPYRVETVNNDKTLKIHYTGVKSTVASENSDKSLSVPEGLLVEVHDGKMTGQVVSFKLDSSAPKTTQPNWAMANQQVSFRGEVSVHSKADLSPKQVVGELKKMIIAGDGLTESEASGLLNAWNKQFFQTDGRRLIVRMRRADYDYRCPIEVSPVPTKMARVGLILTEL